MRWQATTSVRLQPIRVFHDLPIEKVFRGAEDGNLLSPWESDARIISISEGQASTLLLAWVLARRLKAAVSKCEKGQPANLAAKLEWKYEEDGKTIRKLLNLGFESEVKALVGITEKDAGVLSRLSTLREDLHLLGLSNQSGAPTERVRFSLTWIKARLDERNQTSELRETLGHAVREWLGSGGPRTLQLANEAWNHKPRLEGLPTLCWILLAAATKGSVVVPEQPDWDSFQKIQAVDFDLLTKSVDSLEEETSTFSRLCRLVPPLHILVRAKWSRPLRWIFVPLAVESPLPTQGQSISDRSTVRIHSGLILMLEDEVESAPYRSERESEKSPDRVVYRLQQILPLLTAVASIEGEHVREDLIQGQERWQALRDTVDDTRHLISNIRMDLGSIQSEDSQFVVRLLANLERRFLTLPETARPEKRARALVDVAKVAEKAASDFNSYYPRRFGTLAEVDLEGGDFIAQIHPIEESYVGESEHSVAERAEAAMELLLLEMLVERVPSRKRPITLRVIDRKSEPTCVTIEVLSDMQLKEWKSPPETLDSWSRGRGSYLTFSLAGALGAFEMESKNEGPVGVTRLRFWRGEP